MGKQDVTLRFSRKQPSR